MISHYIKFAFRSLFRDKVFSIINILGLSIGLTGAFVVSIYLINELSFDQFHEKKDRIYRINTEWLKWNSKVAKSPKVAAESFNNEFPEVLEVVTIKGKWLTVELNEERFPTHIKFTSNNFFEIFNFPLISGNVSNPLKDINDVVISEKYANKLFNDLDIIGQTFNIKYEGVQRQLKVTALMKDIPWNSSIRGDIIGNFEFIKDTAKVTREPWSDCAYNNYILIQNGINIKELKNKVSNYKNIQIPEDVNNKYTLHSINDFHLKASGLANNDDKVGDLKQVKLFLLIGFILLFIAASNFIVLSTAKAINRTREISLRKIMGASRKVLIKQISWEAGLFCLLVIPIGLIIALLVLPYASILIGYEVEFHTSNLGQYIFSIILIFFLLLFFSGLYIALYTSKFDPLDAFRGNISNNEKFIGRKIMITLQIFIFISLFICTLVIHRQINYSKNMDQGFNKENLHILTISESTSEERDGILNEIKMNPKIKSAAFTSYGPPANSFTTYNMSIDQDPTNEINLEVLSVEFDFIETMEFELIEGRSFDRNSTDNPENVCLITESVMKKYDLSYPIGHYLGTQKIIGVLKDFHLHTTQYEVKPMVIRLANNYAYYLYIRIPNESIDETRAYVNEIYESFFPNSAFRFRSFSSEQDRAYREETDFARNLTIFAGLAIFLSIMGLFGLTLFTIEKRIKEIGIRKVHGASINSIMVMINKEFAILVGIATILAWPVAWYFMDEWLQNFAYTIDLPYELYILSGVIALFIVLVTVSIRSLKAANKNPVDAIRYE